MDYKDTSYDETNDYVRFNASYDLVSSLRQAARSLAVLDEDDAWKWLVLSLHSAVQTFMACHLTASDGFGALKAHRNDPKYKAVFCGQDSDLTEKEYDKIVAAAANERLAGFKELLRRVAETIDVDAGDKAALDRLHKDRCEFAHYIPRHSWSIHKDRILKEHIPAALQVMESLLQTPSSGGGYGFNDWDDRVDLDKEITNLREAYETAVCETELTRQNQSHTIRKSN